MIHSGQLFYLDGHEDKEQRMHGAAEGFNRLQKALMQAGPLQ